MAASTVVLALASFLLFGQALFGQWETEAGELHRYEATETHMGTAFTIVLYAANQATANRAFHAAFSRIDELNHSLSDYSSESEVSRLCASSPHNAPVKVSTDLWTVLFHSQRLSLESDGAFDVTVGPLTKLWRRARRRKQLPEAAQLKSALNIVGHQKIRFDQEQKTVQLKLTNMRIDFGGIAKGYALDEALRTMKSNGVPIAFVNGGGDIAAGDAPPGERGWQVKLAGLRPGIDSNESITISEMAVATSGDAWQYVELDGRRYSHLVDPKTGLGLTSQSTVSVVAPTGIEADSLASAISVMGSERGMALVEAKPDVAARIITIEQGLAHETRSSRFQRLLSPVARK